MTRRGILQLAGLGSVSAPFGIAAPRGRDVRIRSVETRFEDFSYRTPYKFGGRTVDRVTLLNVNCTVEDRRGRSAAGFGSMPLGNIWSFPSRVLTYEQTLSVMKALAERIQRIGSGYGEYDHPVDIGVALEPEYLKAANDVAREGALAEPVPKL